MPILFQVIIAMLCSACSVVPEGKSGSRVIANCTGSACNTSNIIIDGSSSSVNGVTRITALTPNNGEPGTLLEIQGEKLINNSTAVEVFFNTTPALIVSQSDSLIRLTVPALAGNLQSPADIVLKHNSEEVAAVSAGFTYNGNPACSGALSFTSVEPNSGTAATVVTINGTDFSSGITVNFGGIVVNPTSVTGTQITVNVPNLNGQCLTLPCNQTITLQNPNNCTVQRPGAFNYINPDKDNDGFSILNPGNAATFDCDDNNPNIFPGHTLTQTTGGPNLACGQNPNVPSCTVSFNHQIGGNRGYAWTLALNAPLTNWQQSTYNVNHSATNRPYVNPRIQAGCNDFTPSCSEGSCSGWCNYPGSFHSLAYEEVVLYSLGSNEGCTNSLAYTLGVQGNNNCDTAISNRSVSQGVTLCSFNDGFGAAVPVEEQFVKVERQPNNNLRLMINMRHYRCSDGHVVNPGVLSCEVGD